MATLTAPSTSPAAPAAAERPAGHPHAVTRGPLLPAADAAEASFAEVDFKAATALPHAPGIFVLTRAIHGLAYPAFFGEGEDMAAAAEAVKAAHPAQTALTNGIFYMERANPRLRAHTLRDLVGKFDPPLNIADRKGPADPEITVFIPDQATDWPEGMREQLTAEIHVTEEDLDRLVREFYSAAGSDPLLGPVFARAIPDWEEHYRIVHNFWSRSLLGTTRYSGTPFSAHITLHLKPEHFDRWVSLFKQTANRVLEPVAASRAISKVEHMSACFQAGLFPPSMAHGAMAHAKPSGV